MEAKECTMPAEPRRRRKRRKPQAETRQPTDAELQARIDRCRQLLGQGKYDGEVKKIVAAQFKLSPRTVERYLRRARDLIVADTGRDKQEHRAESYAFYVEVRGNAKALPKDRLRAQERIDKLLGLEEPQRHQLAIHRRRIEDLSDDELQAIASGTATATLEEPPTPERNGHV
jgi:hypothetical protein